MIDTGGTILAAAKLARKRGARRVFVCATHGLFSNKEGQPPIESRFVEEDFTVVITNTIPRDKNYLDKNSDWLHVAPINDLLVKAIYESTLSGGSVSSLFDDKQRHLR